MNITSVKVKKLDNAGRRKAVASITIDNDFVIHDISVIQNDSNMFISMPSKKLPNGEFKDIAHPINTETRTKIQNAIIEEYNRID